MANKNKFFLGKVADHATERKEWFFGDFMKEPLLQSSLVEVAWQHVSNKKPEVTDTHFHKRAVEITIVIKGSATFLANGEKKVAKAGDFWVVYPETVIESFATGEETELVVIKAPSIPGDKYSI